MNNADLKKVLEDKIPNTGKVIFAHTGTQVIAGGRSTCALALVERNRGFNSEHAVFIFSSETSELQLSDLTCDQVLPLDAAFICKFVPAEGESKVRVQLTDSGGLSVSLELTATSVTESFIQEIFSLIDKASCAGGRSKTHSSWTNRPPVLVTDITPVEQAIFQSSEMALQRQNMSKGGQISALQREKLVKKHMDDRFHEYTYTKDIRVMVATWNVNGQSATTSLVDWLTMDPEPPDIYAIGFQELDLSKEAFIFNDTPREEEWLIAVTKALYTHRLVPYRKVCLVRLVGMMLIVFVKESHVKDVKNVVSDTVGTGIMGKMGNKGGVGVRLDFHSTSICFVNSHLAAHVEEFERRNQDYNDIVARMAFTLSFQRYSIKDHDQVFWLGDLNYRVTDLDLKFVKKLLEHKQYEPVLEKDQLIIQKMKRKVFDGYHEGPIQFHPTYKYDPGTDNWDSSEKGRAPAWCDRILWKGDGIEQISYRSHPSLKISDHKPVSSVFASKVRIIDETRQRKVQEEVIKALDKLENEFLPQVMVDTNEKAFESVRYLEPVSQELIIANTGQVPAQFEFINKLDDASFCKPWLHVEPWEGIINPADKCDVKLEVFIDKRTAYKFNSGEDKLYDILVLHLTGGKDIFISISGNYERSCFGSSIEALVRISVPIREIPIGKLIELEKNHREGLTGQEPYPVPKEMWFLVDHLYRHGLKQSLFVQPGLHSELIQIRNWLDNGSSDPLPGSVFSMAEALLLLLESTAEPVIPYSLQAECLTASPSYYQCKQLVQSLPEHRRNVFLYICVFLQELLAHSNENELDAKILATIFSSIFMRDAPSKKNEKREKSAQLELDRKKTSFVHHFLINDQSEFILGR